MVASGVEIAAPGNSVTAVTAGIFACGILGGSTGGFGGASILGGFGGVISALRGGSGILLPPPPPPPPGPGWAIQVMSGVLMTFLIVSIAPGLVMAYRNTPNPTTCRTTDQPDLSR